MNGLSNETLDERVDALEVLITHLLLEMAQSRDQKDSLGSTLRDLEEHPPGGNSATSRLAGALLEKLRSR